MLLEMSRAVVKSDTSTPSSTSTCNITNTSRIHSPSEDISYASFGRVPPAHHEHLSVNVQSDCPVASSGSVGLKGLLSAVNANSLTASSASGSSLSTGPNYEQRNSYAVSNNGSVILEDSELWEKFHECQNEMIVTKSGRRMFPVVQVNVQGLEPNSMYSLVLEFSQIGGGRWKYVSGKWTSSGKAEPAPRQGTLYVHPDSPNFGNFWMKAPVNFGRVKLTNKPSAPQGQIVLNSLHKYQPIVHVVGVQAGVNLGQTPPIMSATFPQTQFIAVTAYQNEDITALKVTHNPYAKAFQESRDRAEGFNTSTGSYVGSMSPGNARVNRSNESQSYDPHQNIYHHRSETQSPTTLTNRTAYPITSATRQSPSSASWYIPPIAGGIPSSTPFHTHSSRTNNNTVIPEINLTTPLSHQNSRSSITPLHRILGPYPNINIKRGSPESQESTYNPCSQTSSPARVTPDSPSTECHHDTSPESSNFTSSCSFPVTVTATTSSSTPDNYSSYVTSESGVQPNTETVTNATWPSSIHHPFGAFHHHPLHHYSTQSAPGSSHLHHGLQISHWGFPDDSIRPHPALLYGVFGTRNASSTGLAQTVLGNARDYLQSDSTGSNYEGDSPSSGHAQETSGTRHSTPPRSQNQWSPISPGSSGS